MTLNNEAILVSAKVFIAAPAIPGQSCCATNELQSGKPADVSNARKASQSNAQVLPSPQHKMTLSYRFSV
jgi:hypothetical protein